jgi:uncharacterized repeat protein (TIGR01451 family)
MDQMMMSSMPEKTTMATTRIPRFIGMLGLMLGVGLATMSLNSLQIGNVITGALLPQKADLFITTTVAKDTVSSSEEATVHVNITNAGSASLKNIVLLQNLDPSGIAFTGAGMPEAEGKLVCKTVRNMLTCNITTKENLGGGQTTTLTLQYETHKREEAPRCDTFVTIPSIEIRSLSEMPQDPNPSNNTSNAVPVRIDCSDITSNLAVNVAAQPTPVEPGTAITYTITARNNGPASAKDLSLLQKYPPNLHFQSASKAQCIADENSHEINCPLGNDETRTNGVLQAGESEPIELHFNVDPTAGCSTITAESFLGNKGTIDPNPDDNTVQTPTEVTCPQ